MNRPVKVREKIRFRTRDEIFKRIEHERKKLDNPNLNDNGRCYIRGVVHTLVWVMNMSIVKTEGKWYVSDSNKESEAPMRTHNLIF